MHRRKADGSVWAREAAHRLIAMLSAAHVPHTQSNPRSPGPGAGRERLAHPPGASAIATPRMSRVPCAIDSGLRVGPLRRLGRIDGSTAALDAIPPRVRSVSVRNYGDPIAADPPGGWGGWGLGKPDRTVWPTARLSVAGA